MLHIVQIVMWGVAETPRVFVDEAKARAAYVEGAKTHWEQRYSAYCEHHGLSGDSFAAAQAFVNTIDVSEKSRLHYWTFNAEELDLGELKDPQGETAREELRQVAEGIIAVQTGLTRLLDDLSILTDRFSRMDLSPVAAPTAAGPEKAVPALSAIRQEEPEPDPATYTTPEWKAFVGTIKRFGSGSKNEFQLLRRDDWRQDVYSNRTSLEYWDWVADRVRKFIGRAKKANYSIIEDPDSPGCYRYTNQEGIASDDCCNSEWEAWCAAGLDLEANCRDAAG
jgi:hypothetical protein